MYCGYIVKLDKVRPHPNADRLKIATFFNCDTCVSTDVEDGAIGVYFPSDGQLSIEFCEQNHMCRKHQDGTPDTGYLDPDKRNITAIKLRGEKSDGIFCSLVSLEYTGVDLSTFSVGDQVVTVNGHEICTKYIPNHQYSHGSGGKTKAKVNKKNITPKETAPYFAEHIDTPQLRFCASKFKPGDVICLTEKVHGTSSRNANALVITHKQSFFDKLFHRMGKEISVYKNLVGTRRTTVKDSEGGYYGSNGFRIRWGEKFKNRLYKGEEVFGEIAGFTDDGAPIMGIVDNKKTRDKEFIKQYGEKTCFSYGCEPTGKKMEYGADENGPFAIEIDKPKSRYFIYRMNYTTPDGDVIEYSWDMVKLRAEMLGFETVPELERFIYSTEEDFYEHINKWLDKPSTIDHSHVIEGVVIRALNSPFFEVAKEKSFNFKVLEGICKAEADAPDMEEADELIMTEV